MENKRPELTPEMRAYLSSIGTRGGEVGGKVKCKKGFAVNREALVKSAVTRARRAETRRVEAEAKRDELKP
jgi:hypothetical protein